MGHGHDDYFSLILHGKGRLLYPDINVIQYEPRWLNWTADGIGHSTLLIDHESPSPGKQTTRHDFAPEVKFFAVEGSAFERSVQERAVLMTDDYLVDVFRAADSGGGERTFDWVVHGLGRLYPGNPAAYRPSTDLVPHYGWIDRERSRAFDGSGRRTGCKAAPESSNGKGKQPESETGVRVTVLGAPGTRVYVGEGPLVDAPPHHRLDGHAEPSCPLVLVRRKASAATFAAVHEPYSGRSPTVRGVSLLQESAEGIGMKVEAEAFSDRLLLAFGSSSGTISFARRTGRRSGSVDTASCERRVKPLSREESWKGFRLRAANADGLSLTVNGKQEPVACATGFWFTVTSRPKAVPDVRASPPPPWKRPSQEPQFIPISFLRKFASRPAAPSVKSR